MIKSMTGYGRQKGENERREVQVEIKSVNHRYLDLNVKVPRIYSFLEEPIKTAVSAAVARGKVDIYLSIAAKEGGDVKVSPNLALAGEYLRALEQVRDTYSLKDDISVMELAHMPDLLTVAREEPDAEEVKAQVLEVLGRALEEYNAMRRTEGERLCEDIARRGQEIGKMVDQVCLLYTSKRPLRATCLQSSGGRKNDGMDSKTRYSHPGAFGAGGHDALALCGGKQR